ncbi:SPOR domain-containing protein [Alteromonas oceanisediminis]|uniref:SPOR domain-containing protein n=1 Tax=Alteromonas oceanisediminis TaxID=2836180 RepID=UPI001BD9C480|nr:SPOR domain-containing protein [Alteromonas oceanisediminis]MBT0587712.1 SPOR domain-containing protein [Alteromonas oceanisediminis]
MSQKDYVKRGRGPSKKVPPKKPMPWVSVVIALVLIMGFIAFLWQIKDNAPDAEAPVKVPEIVSPQTEEELPELVEEEWDFIKTLPGYEVEIDETERPVSTKRYLLQCGSFRQEARAEEMRAQIAFVGLEAAVRPSDGSNGRWYRVVLGPFDSKRDAERGRHTIRDTGIRTCQIRYWTT